jgi:hypothetical protein
MLVENAELAGVEAGKSPHRRYLAFGFLFGHRASLIVAIVK